MKKMLILASAVLFAITFLLDDEHTQTNELSENKIKLQKSTIVENYGKIPLAFTENSGRYDSRVKFTTRGFGAAMFFTPEGTTFLLSRETEESHSLHTGLKHKKIGIPEEPGSGMNYEPEIKYEYYSLKLHFVGANTDPEVTGENRLSWSNNYFTGNDPSKWRTNVPNYSKVRLKNLYEGIDLLYYGNQNNIKYDFVVQPGADPAQILLAYDFGDFSDIELLKITSAGELEVKTPFGKLIERKPYSYQVINERVLEVDVQYKITHPEKNRYTFSIASYNPEYPLIIDPELTYSTFLGGSDSDYGYGIAVDASGNAYITGHTNSSNFPITSGVWDNTLGGTYDVFVSKINSSGNALIYLTYIGGVGIDYGKDITIDVSGNAYITGSTYLYEGSNDFPTTEGVVDNTFSGTIEAFVTKLNSTGSALVYSTFLGGSGYDSAHRIAIDTGGNAYVTGSTSSSDFPRANALDDTLNGSSDAFVSKLNPTGTALVYSTFLGGGGSEYEGSGIAVDASGNTYVTGRTNSSDFPTTPNAYDTSYNAGHEDIFIAKLNPSGSALVYSTYLGGTKYGEVGECVNDITIDNQGNAYIIGETEADDFPTTPGAFDETHNGGHIVFVTKLNSSGSDLVYSTFLSGTSEYPPWDTGNGIAVDVYGNAYVTGYTESNDFPTTSNAINTSYNGNNDAFLTKLNADGSALIYSTFVGGGSSDAGHGIAIYENVNVFITGNTYSRDFPTTPGVYDSTYNGGYHDVFITKFNLNSLPVIKALSDTATNEAVTFTRQVNASDIDSDPLTYSLTEAPEGMTIGLTSGLITWTPGYDDAGTYPVTVKVEDGISGEDTESFTLTVNNVNIAPVISALSDTTTYEGILFTRQVYAYDPEGSSITYSLTGQPEGMTIGSSSGLITWTPGYDQSGFHNFGVKASDDLGGKDTERFTLAVINVNKAPVIIPTTLENAEEREAYSDTVKVADPDADDVLTFTVITGPGWLTVSSVDTSGILSGMPMNEDVGTNIPVSITVADSGGLSDTLNTTITVQALIPISWSIDYPAGWSMASLGLDFLDSSLSSVFPNAVSAYEFDNGYNQAADLSKGKGYWINLAGAYTSAIEDKAIDELVFNLTAGWHMIGSISYPLAVGNIVQEPPNSIVSIYRFAGRYSLVTDFLRQGEGYWIKVANNAALTFSSGNVSKSPVVTYVNERNKDTGFTLPITFRTGNHSKVLKIHFKEKAAVEDIAELNNVFELPPLPPAGILDVRFERENTNGLEALYIDEDETFERDILLSVPYNEQLIVRWDKSILEPGRFMLKDGLGGLLFSDIDMSSEGELVITSQGLKALRFSYLGKIEEIIADYELLPNYPNPFNPSTKIEYTIKSPGSVKLSVYNVLGQKVKVLVDEYKQSGRYSVEWDGTDQSGSSVAGGLYVYRLQVNDFTATKKMVYIR